MIDFRAIARTSFSAKRPGADPAGQALTPHARRQAVRRTAMLAEAKDVLPHLPGPGEALHAIMTGRYDLMHLLVAILEFRAEPVESMLIATLSYNGANLAELKGLLDSGKVKRLGLVCSKFFSEHNKWLYEQTVRELGERGGRVACPRSHCKVVCLHWQSGDKMVCEGSANLRTNSNREQLALMHDAALHDWHAAWIEQELMHHAAQAQT